MKRLNLPIPLPASTLQVFQFIIGLIMLSCGARVRPKSDEVHGQTEFQDF